MSKIDGEMLLGFGDFFEEGLVIGAAPAKTPPKSLVRNPTGKTSATKGTLAAAVSKYPKLNVKKGQSAIEKHGAVLKAAHTTATKAVNAVMKAVKVLGNAKVAAKTAKPVTAHIGAVVATAAQQGKLTAKAQAAVQKHNAAVQKANQANKVLAQHALKAKAAVADLAKKMTAQKKVAIALRTKGNKKTAVGHMMSDPMIGCEVAQSFQDFYEAIGHRPNPQTPGFLTDGSPDPGTIIGQVTQGTVPPDPANPGSLMDGSPDPAYGATTTSDPSLGIPSLGDPSLDPLGMDSGAQLPPVPDVGYQEPDCHAVGGIVYTGQKGYPDGYCGSLGLMTRTTDSYEVGDTMGIDGTDHFGYVWGKFWDKDGHGGIAFGNNLDSGTWNAVYGRNILGDNDWHKPVSLAEAISSNGRVSPQGKPYGPLVGNPNMPDFAQMRVDFGGNMFWYPQAAPDWLTFPLKQAAALTAQAAAAAQAAADAANAAAAAAMQQQAALAQAQQDAANALAESQATSAANVQNTQTAAQQAQDQAAAEAAAQQQIVAQSQQQLAEQQAAQPLLVQQAQQNLSDQQAQMRAQQQAQQQMLDYAQAHPDEAYGPDDGGGDAGADDGSGGDDGGGDGGGDDGGDYGTQSDDDILSQAAQVGGFTDDLHEPPFPGQGANDFESSGAEGQFDDGLGVPGADLMGDFDGEGFTE